jgi:Spy/CpxP family protein refolding chaperone
LSYDSAAEMNRLVRMIKPIVHVLLLSFGTTLLAQGAEQKRNEQSAPPPGDRSRERFQGGAYGPRVGGGFERAFSVLTEEQRASFRRAMEENRKAVRSLEQKSSAARRELLEAAVVDKFDEAKVREKLNALMAADADLTMVRIKAFSKMEPALSAQQIEKLRNPEQPDGPGGPESRKRSPDAPRDENGLPPKKIQ